MVKAIHIACAINTRTETGVRIHAAMHHVPVTSAVCPPPPVMAVTLFTFTFPSTGQRLGSKVSVQ